MSAMSIPASESCSDIHHQQGNEQISQGHYNTTLEHTPWANIHKAPGLEPLETTMCTMPQASKPPSSGTEALYQSFEILSVNSNGDPSSSPLTKHYLTPLMLRKANRHKTISPPTISAATTNTTSPSTAMTTEFSPVPIQGHTTNPFHAPAPGPFPVFTAEPAHSLTLAASTSPATDTKPKTRKLARERRRRYRKREVPEEQKERNQREIYRVKKREKIKAERKARSLAKMMLRRERERVTEARMKISEEWRERSQEIRLVAQAEARSNSFKRERII